MTFKEFGINITRVGEPTSSGDWSRVFQKAVQSLDIGGVLKIPKGRYSLTNELLIKGTHPGSNIPITIEGEGAENTILDFEGVPQDKNGLVVEKGVYLKLRNIGIRGAKNNNIAFKSENGTVPFSHVELTNIRTSHAGASGISFEKGFMIRMQDVFSANNKKHGFHFQGHHHSVSAISCFADKNEFDGWVLRDMNYCSFIACGSSNNRNGWNVKNIKAVNLVSCGAEYCDREGFYVFSSEEKGKVVNLSLDGCFGHGNNKAGGYPNFLHIVCQQGGTATVLARGCVDSFTAAPNGTSSVVIDGTGSKIIDEYNTFTANLSSINEGVRVIPATSVAY